MSDSINNQPVPLAFVEIRTGEVVQAAYTDGKRFWKSSQLRQDGQPNRTFRGCAAQIIKSQYGGYFSGRHAPLIPAREVQANVLRARVRELEHQLHEAETALCEYYINL